MLRHGEQAYNRVLRGQLVVIRGDLWLRFDMLRVRMVICKVIRSVVVLRRASRRDSYWSASSPLLSRVPYPSQCR